MKKKDIKINNCYNVIRKNFTIFDNLPEILRPSPTAELLGISVNTIYDWKYRGKTRNIPKDLFIKINRSLYIRTEVLKDWIISSN
jgi:predicted DNA-binding transcriptional regulator AlpA